MVQAPLSLTGRTRKRSRFPATPPGRRRTGKRRLRGLEDVFGEDGPGLGSWRTQALSSTGRSGAGELLHG